MGKILGGRAWQRKYCNLQKDDTLAFGGFRQGKVGADADAVGGGKIMYTKKYGDVAGILRTRCPFYPT